MNVPEGLFGYVIGAGCDTHHEVVTTPDETAVAPDDTLNARLCSRFPSIMPKPGILAIPDLAIDPGSCPGHPDEAQNMTPVPQQLAPQGEGVVTKTNVYCHKFHDVAAPSTTPASRTRRTRGCSTAASSCCRRTLRRFRSFRTSRNSS